MRFKLLILFSSFLVTFCHPELHSREALVSVERVSKAKTSFVSIESNAKAIDEIVIKSEIEGKIIEIFKNEGDKVKQNEVIAVVEDIKYLAKYKSAQEKLFSMESKLKKSSLKLERFNELFSKEIISNQEYEEALYDHNSSLSDFNSLLEELKQAKIELDNCYIKSPFNGIISNKYINLGEFVSKDSKIVEITNNEKIEIPLYVPKNYLLFINEGDPVEVQLSGGRKYSSKISKIVRKIDKSLGTFLVKIYILEKNDIISGEDVKVVLSIEPPINSFRVNKDSVNNEDGKKIIFKVKNNRVYPVEIVIVDLQDNYYIATGQIKENDIIVVDGNESLRPKQPIKILKYLK